MAKPKPTDELTARISRFLTNVLGTPACHNFHAEAAALRDIVGIAPPAIPEKEPEPTRFTER